jgi:deoxyribonuclease (pyrimidine dimer)
MRFYHDKLQYLMKRWIALKVEMIVRGFNPTIHLHYKELQLRDEFQGRFNDFVPNDDQIQSMKERIRQRINEKPTWYRYRGQYKEPQFFEELMK